MITDNAKPIRWMTYNGDATDTVGNVMGPTLMGDTDFVTCVTAEYDPETNKTRCGFVYGARCEECGVRVEGGQLIKYDISRRVRCTEHYLQDERRV